ncbi:MAG: hypothetical protein GPJ51_02015 [Candidatus Heimdallarchaeota archaeon]|nr:hypothetical protein [Candidatus Heimdallarchaeota archaeon]
MKILVTYHSVTGNTKKIAEAIYETSSENHEADLKDMNDISMKDFANYDLVFLGSACHDSDLALPVLQLLEQTPSASGFKLAGFVTHASYTSEAGEYEKSMYEQWAGKCIKSFESFAHNNNIKFLGFFNCMGIPSPPIEKFIHDQIVTDKEQWSIYLEIIKKHPDENDLANAREFARAILGQID